MNILQSYVLTEKNPINAKTSIGTSKRYNFANSQNIIDRLKIDGFNLVGTSYAKTKKTEYQGYQKHIMIFEKPDLKIDDNNTLQLLVTNSHKGDCALKFDIGVFRAICANGLVAGDNYGKWSIRHDAPLFVEKFDNTLTEIYEKMPLVASMVKRMKEYKPTLEEIEYLKETAVKLRVNNDNLLTFEGRSFNPRRFEDQKQDLYTVFNRIQETVMRGGIKYKFMKVDEDGIKTIKNMTTSAVKSLDLKRELNKALWNLTEALVA